MTTQTQTKTQAHAKIKNAEPLDIYGNWHVTDVIANNPGKDIGITKDKSKFRIKHKGNDGSVLQKKHDEKDVRWDGSATKIDLTTVTDPNRTTGC